MEPNTIEESIKGLLEAIKESPESGISEAE